MFAGWWVKLANRFARRSHRRRAPEHRRKKPLAPGVERLEDRSVPSAGALGLSVHTDLGFDDSASAVALQADGKMVVGGTSNGAFALARYTASGALDDSFGSGGKVLTAFTGTLSGLAIQPDGASFKVLVAGSVANDFFLARYDSGGNLDPTFGDLVNPADPTGPRTGTVATDFFGSVDTASALALGPSTSGAIVVVGKATTQAGDEEFALARYHADGTPDLSFGPDHDGKVATAFGFSTSASSIAVQADDGKLIVGGTATRPVEGTSGGLFNGDFFLARYDSGGNLDPTFGDLVNPADPTGPRTGTVSADFTSHYAAGWSGFDVLVGVAIQPDATGFHIVAAGSSLGIKLPDSGSSGPAPLFVLPDLTDPDFALVRYDSSGTRDTAFGPNGDGLVLTDLAANSADIAAGLAIQDDGKIVVAGSSVDATSGISQFALARYNAGGSLDDGGPADTTPLDRFGAHGTVLTDLPGEQDTAAAVAIQPDGKIVVAGSTVNAGTGQDFALARYEERAVLPDWVRQFELAPGQFQSLTTDSAGNVYAVGFTPASSGLFVRKYTPGGDVVWTSLSEGDEVYGIAVDDSGVYIAGQSRGIAFVRKFERNFDAEGKEEVNEVWDRRFGSLGSVWAVGIAANASGVYVAGSTLLATGDVDAFVLEYDPAGVEGWVRVFGTSASDFARGIAADASGVYVAGSTFGSFTGQAPAGNADVFVRKYDNDGSELWTSQFGSDLEEDVFGVTTSASGAYVTGTATLVTPEDTITDNFVSKIDPSDGSKLWTSQFSSDGNDRPAAIAADALGVYVAGTTTGTFPGQASAGDFDAFVSKFDTRGNELWVTQFGSDTEDTAHGLAVSGSAVYVGGQTFGTLLGQPPGHGGTAFVVKLMQDPYRGGPVEMAVNPATVGEDLPAVIAALRSVGGGGILIPQVDTTVTTDAQLDAEYRALNRVDEGSTRHVVVRMDLKGSTVQSETALKMKGGLTLVEMNGVTLANSPALTLVSGDVRFENMTVLNDRADPTFLVQGGSLTVRNSTIQESTTSSQAIFQITGGTVDLGRSIDPLDPGYGGNTLNIINGPGEFIHNTSGNAVSALGNRFEVDGAPLTDPFRIEDLIFHALDAGGSGLVSYVGGNVYVTENSGSIQRGIDAVADGGTVHVEGSDYSPYRVGARPLTIAFRDGPVVQLHQDSSGQTTLVVRGTDRADHIAFRPGRRAGDIEVALGDLPTGAFSPTSAIVAHGGKGDDHIAVSDRIFLQALLFGDEGNDHLLAGGGPTVLVGSSGDDHLDGGNGNDVLIGGTGRDQLEGRRGNDILVGGTTDFDADEAKLRAILAKWAADHDPSLLTRDTVHDDGVADHLDGGMGADLIFATPGGPGKDRVN